MIYHKSTQNRAKLIHVRGLIVQNLSACLSMSMLAGGVDQSGFIQGRNAHFSISNQFPSHNPFFMLFFLCINYTDLGV